MSDKQPDLDSLFDKQQSKKQKTQKLQQQQQKKTEDQLKRAEDEKQVAAKTTGDFESSEEEDTSAQIEIGAGAKVKDIKEVKKEKQLA